LSLSSALLRSYVPTLVSGEFITAKDLFPLLGNGILYPAERPLTIGPCLVAFRPRVLADIFVAAYLLHRLEIAAAVDVPAYVWSTGGYRRRYVSWRGEPAIVKTFLAPKDNSYRAIWRDRPTDRVVTRGDGRVVTSSRDMLACGSSSARIVSITTVGV